MSRATIIFLAILILIVVGAVALGTINTKVPRTRVETAVPYTPPAR